MSKQIIRTTNAPTPGGPYSQGTTDGKTIYVAGQGPNDPATGKTKGSTFEEQAEQTFSNVKGIVEAAGATMADVMRVNVYLADLADFPKMNEIYKKYFPEPYPARTTVGSQLLSHISIEVDCIAVKG